MTKILIDEAPTLPECKYGNEPASCTSSPMDCQCEIDAFFEQPTTAPDPDELTIAYMSGVYEGKKRKPWVGLTDEEKSDLWCKSTGRDCVNEDTHVFADAIEAKLKEKNTSGKATEKGGAA